MTTASGQLAKAKITNLTTSLTTSDSLECMFNPSEYTFSRSNEWKSEDVPGQEIPKLTFAGGKSGVLTLKLIFDTNEQHVSNIAAGSDVRQVTRKLWGMMKVAETTNSQGVKSKAPPNVQFQWGRLWSVTAVITQIEETFTLFRPDGTPVRSSISLSLQQLFPDDVYPRQNPTSGGAPGDHTRVVLPGETLAGIAYEEYGDTMAWRHIATTNRITDPRRLRPGQVLLISAINPVTAS